MKAKLINQTGKLLIFEFDTVPEVPAGDLDITIKKYKANRSLNANAYLWELLGKQALERNVRGMTVTNWDCYLESLKKYGQFTYIVITPRAKEQFKQSWRECIELGEISINGKTGIQFQCFYGSSTYDSKEFSALLNGVIEDCKELGIETLPPAEIEKMIQLLEKNEKTNKSTTI